MIIISKAEAERMREHIIEPETEMTEMDLFECQHFNEDWMVI